MHNIDAQLQWREGVPVSSQFDDPYFSLEDGLEETRYVFLSGNDLPARFCDGFQIAELGFGTGLGFLCTLEAWRNAQVSGHLHFTSFEAYPMRSSDMAQALAHFPSLAPLAPPLLAAWEKGQRKIAFGDDVTLEVIIGDARETLPQWDKQADAWYLDGFSPAKNPELWHPLLMQSVGDHTKAQGSLATYTAAGAVRRALGDAGFEVTRIKGFGRKRHMSIARLKGTHT